MQETARFKIPDGFKGVHYFTNPTQTDFKTYWNSVEYTFPAHSTAPVIIPNESVEGIWFICNKFARELATLMLYESDKYKMHESDAPMGSGKTPALLTDEDLKPYMAKCLEPLKEAQAEVKKVEIDQTEQKLHKDENGRKKTKILKGDEDLAPANSVLA